jgi:hypothetical protein
MIETHEQWSLRLEARLAFEPALTREMIDEVLREVEAHCADTGQHPRDVFGTPQEFAARTVRERIPVRVRARQDQAGLLPGEYVSLGILQVAVFMVVAAVVLLIESGLWFTVTLAGLTGSVLLAMSLQLASATRAVRGTGRLRAAATLGAGTVVLVLVTACAFTALPDHRLARLPTPVLALAGVLLGAAAWRLDSCTAADSGRPDLDGFEPAQVQDWLRQLEGLLRGRHHLPRRRAQELVTEARQHLALTGRTPVEEFGPVREHALLLADETVPRSWWTREEWQLPLFCLLMLFFWAQNVRDPDWVFWLNTVLLAAGCYRLGASLLRQWRAR